MLIFWLYEHHLGRYISSVECSNTLEVCTENFCLVSLLINRILQPHWKTEESYYNVHLQNWNLMICRYPFHYFVRAEKI